MNSRDADQTNSKLPDLPVRPRNSHKGDYGRAFLLGGSAGMPGAIGLAGMACLRSGAGLVTLAVSSDVINTVASYSPNYMTLGWSMEGESVAATSLAAIREKVSGSSAVAIGPGLGRGNENRNNELLECVDGAEAPVILDADGLNLLARTRPGRPLGGNFLLTPHPGELARLLPGEEGDRGHLARHAAEVYEAAILFKGARTLVTAPGGALHYNTTGNPGMATGGQGDLLTGLLAALAAQGLSLVEAARAGAWLTGRAAELALAEGGQSEESLLPTDVAAFLGAAFRALREEA